MVQEPTLHGDGEEPGPSADLVAAGGALPGPRPPGDTEASALKIFMIVDIRGYTRFSHERGDEAAAKLTAKFAGLVRDVVTAAGSELVEAQGDEAMVVFNSARQALRAGVALQQRFVTESRWAPELPLPVGIGVDVGEAVRVGSGYRGRALNLAARLCSAAGPGEVLASPQVAHLAGQTGDLRYTERPNVAAKGLPGTLVAVQVRPVGEDPAQQLKALGVGLPPLPPSKPSGRRRLLAASAALAVLVTALVVLLLPASAGSAHLTADSVAGLSAGSGSVLTDVALPSAPDGVTVGGGRVWLANRDQDTVTVVDIRSHDIQTVPVGHQPGGIAAGDGSVWVANAFDGTVSRINDASATVVGTIHVGASPTQVAFGDGAVWVANGEDATLTRINPANDSVVATIAVGQSPTGLAVTPGAVWVADSADGQVSQVDPASNTVVSTPHVGSQPTAVAVADGAVYVVDTLAGTISRLDPATGAVTQTVPVGGGPDSIVAAGHSLWVGDPVDDTVVQLDARTGELMRRLHVANAPVGLTVAGGTLWTSVQPAVTLHRGGALRIVGSFRPTGFDPDSPAVYVIGLPPFVPVYDGLVAYNHVGGAAGSLIVPDLATSLPAPTDGGLTYTFRLRAGIRYSDGRSLRAADVRASFERIFREGAAAPYFTGIVGGSACTPRRCDLSRGVVGDDTTATVAFHLSAPDPDFLYQLTTAYIVPAGTPVPAIGPAGTGPYELAGGDLGRSSFDLVRNPYFHQWSRAAQPQGFPDVIHWAWGFTAHQEVVAVENGQADWTADPPGAADVAALRLRFTDLLHQFPTAGTKGVFFNVHVPPFDNVLVRQAVNYAVDRAEAARLVTFGSGAAQCQILPPDFPGYEPYCPYTLHPGAGGMWSAPDLATARALVARSGEAGAAVTVWAHEGDEANGAYMVSVLDSLHFRARLRTLPDVPYFNYVLNSANRAQMGVFGWQAQVPSSGDFLNSLFSCSSFVPDNSNANENVSGFCDPVVQRGIDAALAAQSANLPSTGRLWARVDREITDRAVWAPEWRSYLYDVVSARAANYQNNPWLGIMLDQLWLR